MKILLSQYVFFNFFSVCALIPVLFHITFLVILSSIKKKSPATKHLIAVVANQLLFFAAYFVAAAVYHPLAAYHRFITVPTILMNIVHFTHFWFYYPTPKATSISKKVLIVQYLVITVVTLLFVKAALDSPFIYQFESNNWDFDADKASALVGLVIMAFMAFFVVIYIWRSIVTKSALRWAILAIGTVMIIVSAVPGVLNVMSRKGLIHRGIFQIVYDLTVIFGYFVTIVIYINTTKDRTFFLNKLLAITVSTLLIVFHVISFFTLKDTDLAFDDLCVKDLLVSSRTHRPTANQAYLTKYSPVDDRLETIFSKVESADDITLENAKFELFNTAVYERLRVSTLENQAQLIEELKAQTNRHFAGYQALISDFFERSPQGIATSKTALLAYLDAEVPRIRYVVKEIRNLPKQNFLTALKVYLKKEGVLATPFKNAILAALDTSTLDGSSLKQDILKYFAPMQKAGTRVAKTDRTSKHHYLSYLRFDAQNNVVYEAGFNYLSYRKFMHPTSKKFTVMLIISLAVIFFGFQFFFYGAFIIPIKSLLKAMYRVRDGNLETKIPVRVEDEFGFISHHFNSMIGEIRSAKKALKDYAVELEAKVHERTKELKAARDALWGEMQLAKKIQTVLLPKKPVIDGYRIAAYMEPADEVGGDYYDVINTGGRNWIVIGDVSGHGVPSGLIMMMAQTSIQSVLNKYPAATPRDVLKIVNHVIHQNIERLGEDKYMTITVLACLEEGQFFFSGLHQDILIYRASEKEIETVETRGIWLGVVDEIESLLDNDSFILEPGDIALFFTDGITEAVNEKREMYSLEQLTETFRSLAYGSPEKIKTGILKEIENYRRYDDITMLVVQREA